MNVIYYKGKESKVNESKNQIRNQKSILHLAEFVLVANLFLVLLTRKSLKICGASAKKIFIIKFLLLLSMSDNYLPVYPNGIGGSLRNCYLEVQVLSPAPIWVGMSSWR